MMNDEDFIRDITILMTAEQQCVQFKVKTLIIHYLASNQVHILDWLLLKSPNLISLQFKSYDRVENFDRGLEIKKELKFK
jgi:hypothetical protein